MIEDGVFWLPESPDCPIRGQLSFGVEQAPTVKLTDALTPALRIVSTRTNEDGSVVSEMEPVDDTENFVVHGLLRNSPRAVTLVDCLTTQRRSVVAAGPHFEDQTLRARYIVRGAHVSGDDQLYSGVKIRVRGIDEWARLPGFSISTGSTDEVTLKYARTEMPSARTAAGHLVRFSESMRRSWPGPTGGHIRREAWLMVEDFGEVEFSELSRRYISPLVSVLNLAMGQPAPLTATSVRVQGEGNSDWCNVWHNYISESEAIKNSDYMLPLDSFGVANIARFVDLASKVGHLAPIVADSRSFLSKATLETQVLELTTVAEGIHRALHADEDSRFTKFEAGRIRELVGKALVGEPETFNNVVQGFLKHVEEPNYKTRVRRLAATADVHIPGVAGDIEAWVKLVDKARNLFAHRLRQKLESEAIDKYYAISQSLRWVLATVLLSASGLDPSAHSSAILDFSRYRQYRRNMNGALPAVFKGHEGEPAQ